MTDVMAYVPLRVDNTSGFHVVGEGENTILSH
jgi:hypothetical protein